ncbi:hypothetical protein SNEBB_005274 [Seison nebaliae]|nr:hypothetical protein SNEBB_005274 [Seison nebaliae]
MNLVVRVTLVGERNTGKSGIVERFDGGGFDASPKAYCPTTYPEVIHRIMSIGEQKIHLEVWQAGDMRRIRPNNPASVPGNYVYVNWCLLVCDVSLDNPIKGLDEWVKYFKDSCRLDYYRFLVVANKVDLELSSPFYQVIRRNKKRIKTWCVAHQFRYCETSAKSNYNIYKLFHYIATTSKDYPMAIKRVKPPRCYYL